MRIFFPETVWAFSGAIGPALWGNSQSTLPLPFPNCGSPKFMSGIISVIVAGYADGNPAIAIMTAQSFPKDYNRLSQLLPALKGLAIFMVVIYHLWGYSKGYKLISQIVLSSFSNGVKGLVEGWLNIFCLLGEYGVHFFLIASGFGLGSSWWRSRHLLNGKDRGRFEAIDFWRRRLWRLFPLYWLAHGLALIIAIWQPDWVPFGREMLNRGGIEAIAAIFASLTTLRNIILPYYFFLNGAWWYVGLAVQLYLIFPVLIWVGKRWGWSILLGASLLTTSIYRGLIIALPLNEMATDAFLRGALFPARLFEFVFGMVLAVALLEPESTDYVCRCSQRLLIEKRWLWVNALLWIVGVACDWFADAGWIILKISSDALIGAGEFCLFFQLLSWIKWAKPGLSWLGNYSYGIYLSHMNFIVGIWAILTPLVAAYWLRLGLVGAIACLLGGMFELAYQWLQRRFYLNKDLN